LKWSSVVVDCAHYRAGVRQHEGPLDLERAAELCKGGDEFVWLGLHEPSAEELQAATRSLAVLAQATVHGYTVGFWWAGAIFATGAIVCGLLLRSGAPQRPPPPARCPLPDARAGRAGVPQVAQFRGHGCRASGQAVIGPAALGDSLRWTPTCHCARLARPFAAVSCG
jgi:hypothetical protein